MEFHTLNDFEDYRVTQILEGYTTSFPEEERRNNEQFKALFKNPLVKVDAVWENDEYKAYVITWTLSQGLYLEHFEVYQKYRSQNLGAKILNALQQQHSQIILESEPHHLNEKAVRRLNFYQRNGFTIIDEAYVQPSYGDGKPSVELFLLSTTATDNLKLLKEEIWDTVYR